MTRGKIKEMRRCIYCLGELPMKRQDSERAVYCSQSCGVMASFHRRGLCGNKKRCRAIHKRLEQYRKDKEFVNSVRKIIRENPDEVALAWA